MSLFPSNISKSKIAVLVSSGVDSLVLTALALEHFSSVYPIYVRFGLAWENAELEHLKKLLNELRTPSLKELKILEFPVHDIYESHWSVTGENIPDSSTSDEKVFLPGRNIFLLSKASIWCALNNIEAIALGILKNNPFLDATNDFFTHMESTLQTAFNSQLKILRPLSTLTKTEVVSLIADLPLAMSFSCIGPVRNAKEFIHCGQCNKCAERQKAFIESGLADHTRYMSYSRQI